ncbi:magnesium-translocating P-type ATPase [Luteitalea sp. TBR-22]|nr:magnesium-translocating P-type ATPase [Luteitalea sp. TBR-22]
MDEAPSQSERERTTGAGTGARAWWAVPAAEVAAGMHSSTEGLTTTDAAARLRAIGPNSPRPARAVSHLSIFLRQLRSPLILLLVFAAAVSLALREWTDAAVVLIIVGASAVIGDVREYRAERAAAALRSRLHVRATVIRDGSPTSLAMEDVVPGDVVRLAAGSLVPADGLVLDATDCCVDEAPLTGESFPVAKAAGVVPPDAPLARRTNSVYQGTSVASGTARVLVVATGARTEIGRLAGSLAQPAPETGFDRGLRHFGGLLTIVMLAMVLVVFAAHMLGGRPPAETLLFSIALAVGLSPELLPAVLGVSLARGAQAMATRGVLVRRLHAIENLGGMSVLCTDKTGTLTEGHVEVEGAYDAHGEPSRDVLEAAAINAALETGVASPLDDAILRAFPTRLADLRKCGEVPFDFVRRRVTVAVTDRDGVRLVTKGAVAAVLAACRGEARERAAWEARYEAWTGEGLRVVAVATRLVDAEAPCTREDERDMTLLGFVTFFDRPKAGAAEAVRALADLGIAVKMVTGDSALVARHVARAVGIPDTRVITGRDLDDLGDEAFGARVSDTDLYVEVDPRQKARIISALRARGHVVGFLGDGINDAPAMRAADTSLSVDEAVDVAREAADFVLLDRSLDVIRRGVEEGRRTFATTMTYIRITTSANLGNMASMAVASLALPFLPLTAGQILLNNLLSDVPAIGIAGDHVDPELVARPEGWDLRGLIRFMVAFGALSSVFDLCTFAVLLRMAPGTPATFRTGWFVESLLTELVVALVVRTRRPMTQSRPGTFLLVSTIALIAFALALPYLPGAGLVGFVPLPLPLLATVVGITTAYVGATELQKRWFFGADALTPACATPPSRGGA